MFRATYGSHLQQSSSTRLLALLDWEMRLLGLGSHMFSFVKCYPLVTQFTPLYPIYLGLISPQYPCVDLENGV